MPSLSTPINTLPPLVLAKATSDSITASLKLLLNSVCKFSFKILIIQAASLNLIFLSGYPFWHSGLLHRIHKTFF